MSDISVSVHELKAKLSEYLGRSVHGKERIIIQRRNHPIAMIVPLTDGTTTVKGGLGSVAWEEFSDLASFVDTAYEARQMDGYREVSF
jgi:prevent-host-death family protein